MCCSGQADPTRNSRPARAAEFTATVRSLSGRADFQKYPPGLCAAHNVERGVDFFQRKFVGDDAVERNPAGLVQPDQPRNVDLRDRARRRASRSALC